MNALCLLVFVCMLSFAASTDTVNASTAADHLDDLDSIGETAAQSMMPAQNVAIEPTVEPVFDFLFDDFRLEDQADAADTVPLGTIQPAKENSTAELSIRSDEIRTEDDTIEQSATEKVGEAMLNVDVVAITGALDEGDVPVGAVQPGDETPSMDARRDD
jgi:hypothetical protein